MELTSFTRKRVVYLRHFPLELVLTVKHERHEFLVSEFILDPAESCRHCDVAVEVVRCTTESLLPLWCAYAKENLSEKAYLRLARIHELSENMGAGTSSQEELEEQCRLYSELDENGLEHQW